MKYFSTVLVLILLFAAFVIRVYKFDNPVADWHSWRQADTSAVTRNFVKFGFTPLLPRFDDLSNIASGRDNPQGYRMVEFPLYNTVSYWLYQWGAGKIFTIEETSRFVSILSSVVSILLLYLLVNVYANKKTALITLAITAVLPFFVYYNRTILPENMMIMCVLTSIYILHIGVSRKKKITLVVTIVFSALFASFALLIKPMALFLLFPIPFLIWSMKTSLSRKILLLVFFIVFSLLPFIAWRQWILQFPEGIPAWQWLLNGDGIRFKGAFFYWLFAERYSKLILGYFGVVFLIPGLLYNKGFKKPLLFYLWFLGILLYLCIFATGNVKHDYYQVITIPVLIVFVANGIYFFIENAHLFIHKYVTYTFIVLISIFSLAFSYYHVRGYYWINNPIIVQAGQKANELLPSSAKVIAPYGGDTAFLYQINRQGWPIGFDISDKISKGANYYVSVSPKDSEVLELKENYQTLFETTEFIILKLQ